MLIYTGLKVKLKDENMLFGHLLNEYKKQGCLFVTEILNSNEVSLSRTPTGGLSIVAYTDNIIPIYNDDILSVLKSKQKILKNIEKEVRDIKDFINEKCKNT